MADRTSFSLTVQKSFRLVTKNWRPPVSPFLLLVIAALLASCGGSGSKDPAPVPSIQNINSSTTPSSPVGLPIEINGSGFQSAPGKVVFTQNSITATVAPNAAGWSDTGIVALVPTGNGTNNFSLPGTVTVTVVTSGGTSNAITLNLIQTLSFNPSLMGWATTMPLPTALTGLRAAAVAGANSTTAFAVVTGGSDGVNNFSTVWANNLNNDGTVGSTTNTTWTTIPTNPLPNTRAHHAIAVADPTNSLVATNARFVYVIGGQELATDLPGGTDTVFMAGVDPTTGAVGNWQALTSTLPQPLLGMSATIYNGFLYVAGGLNINGAPQDTVYSAPINPDGTLGAWTTATNGLPTAAAFGTMAAFGGKLYFINGDQSNSTTQNAQSLGTKNVYYADITRGLVGTWTLNPNLAIHDRSKGILWTAFGQFIDGEGVYSGNPGSGEFEVSTVNLDGTLGSWNGLTGGNVPSANVYNAGAFVSPLIYPKTSTPRFLLLGGQAFTSTVGGALSNTVYYNNAP
jgi:hypothetical protein